MQDPFLFCAVQAWGLLANGMGGIDWAGLPLVVEHLGVRDVPRLMDCLQTIKQHTPDRPPEGKDQPTT